MDEAFDDGGLENELGLFLRAFIAGPLDDAHKAVTAFAYEFSLNDIATQTRISDSPSQ